MILEKPFGKDLCSSEALAGEIGAVWPEEALYRIDHYLGKELVQNLLVRVHAGVQVRHQLVRVKGCGCS